MRFNYLQSFPTNQPLITSPALRWPIYRIHGGVCIKWHAITAVSIYIDIGSNFFFHCLTRHEEATMARVLISREMRLRSFDAATQSIRTYLWLISGTFSHGIVRQLRVRVRHKLAFRRAFGVGISPALSTLDTTKKILSRRKTVRARLQVSVTTTRPRYTESSCSPPRGGASIVTSTLTPFSTGIGAHFITRSHPPRRFDRNFRPRGKRNNMEPRATR